VHTMSIWEGIDRKETVRYAKITYLAKARRTRGGDLKERSGRAADDYKAMTKLAGTCIRR